MNILLKLLPRLKRIGAEKLLMPKANFENINGISLSPKKSFCIIKIWMKNCKMINPSIFQDIEHMDKNGCIFKKHVAD